MRRCDVNCSGPLFDVVNSSQDNSPLAHYGRRRAETMVAEHELPVGDCVSETIMRCFETGADEDEVISHLQYAARELRRAATAAMQRSFEGGE